jgi:hypothetical protein
MDIKVYRVNWHRAKARYNRWTEEVKIVRNEMEWTVAWFENMEYKWQRRFEKVKGEGGMSGHACYAKKQVLMWDKMENEARSTFKKCLENIQI